jgi:hypothetical protein
MNLFYVNRDHRMDTSDEYLNIVELRVYLGSFHLGSFILEHSTF